MNKKLRGVYGCYNGNQLMYVGSSEVSLARLESNHRNWQVRGFERTKFRHTLVEEGANWTFKWLIEPYLCSKAEIEIAEGAVIKALKPELNIDLNPYESSIRYGRYERLV